MERRFDQGLIANRAIDIAQKRLRNSLLEVAQQFVRCFVFSAYTEIPGIPVSQAIEVSGLWPKKSRQRWIEGDHAVMDPTVNALQHGRENAAIQAFFGLCALVEFLFRKRSWISEKEIHL